MRFNELSFTNHINTPQIMKTSFTVLKTSYFLHSSGKLFRAEQLLGSDNRQDIRYRIEGDQSEPTALDQLERSGYLILTGAAEVAARKAIEGK